MARMVIVSFKAPRELVEELDALALRLKETRSELIRRAVALYLERHRGRRMVEVVE